jgi:aminoglycoside phosphotransferase (APT) family kinase protein
MVRWVATRITTSGHPRPGFRPPAEEVTQAWDRLQAHLAGHGIALDLEHRPRHFASGYGNLNYLLHADGRPIVLRRPPLGPIPPGANDMGRESRILFRLWRAFPLAPRCLHYCADESVLGAPFLLMEYRPGLVIGGRMPEPFRGRSEAGSRIGEMLVEELARLHGVDPDAVGLGDLGRPEAFLARTRAGWARRAGLAWEGEPPPALGELLAWLGANEPGGQAPVLLHNDFKLDNFVLHPETLEPVALLDWDMGTRGDPLMDLAVLLSYWSEAGDPEAMHDLQQMPTADPGFPTREEMAAAYARQTGRDLSDFLFYRVIATLRLAVVFMQLNRRYREGGTDDPRFAGFGELAEGLLEFARAISKGRAS